MSALGQKQTCAPQKVMSALHLKADIGEALSECPLSARSGHLFAYSITGSAPTKQSRVTLNVKCFFQICGVPLPPCGSAAGVSDLITEMR